MTPTPEMRLMLLESEASVPHVYRDPKGFITIGVGCALLREVDLVALPFVNKSNNALATDAEKNREWVNINNLEFGKSFSSGYYNQFTKLILPNQAIESLLDNRISEFLTSLQREYSGYSQFPNEVKLAMLDMAFNLGMGGLATFVEFLEAIKQQDWYTAAIKSNRAEPISIDRNKKIKALLVAAAEKMFEGKWVGQHFADITPGRLECSINRTGGFLAGTITLTEDDGEVLTTSMKTPTVGSNRSIHFTWERSVVFSGTLPPGQIRITGKITSPGESPVDFYLNR